MAKNTNYKKPNHKDDYKKNQATSSSTSNDGYLLDESPVHYTTVEQDDAKGERWWEKNYKKVLIIAGIIILIVVAWFAYKKYVQKPKDTVGEDAIYPAERLFDQMTNSGFSKDSVNVLLNGGVLGNTSITGLIKVAQVNKGSKAANRANYMIGATYLQSGDFSKAITYLNKYEAHGAYQMDITKNLMLGHAYAESGKQSEALDHYKKAGNINAKDEQMSGSALFTAGMYADAIGKTNDAVSIFKDIKKKFPKYQGVQNGEVDKYLAKLGHVTEK